MNTKYYFLKIIRSYILSEKIDSNDNIDWDEIFRLAQIHNITGILAAMNRKYSLGFPDKYVRQLDASMYSSVSMSVMWDKVYSEISSALASKKIKNIVVKGPVVKRYYPDPDLRTMGI